MKKSMKKMIFASMAVAATFGFFGMNLQTAEAAYQLSDEVKTATPALLEATEIGLRSYDNPSLQNLDNKDAIVVMSFGTTYKETREKTIDATVNAIKAAHPGVKVVTAFTSHIIIDRIKANEGITYPTPEEALKQLKAEGYTRIAITNLNIIPGIEYKYNVAVFNQYKHDFKKMTLGTPLMYWMGQEHQRDDLAEFVTSLSFQFPERGKKDAILLLAHGTPDPANAYYSVIQNRLDDAGYENVFVYSVEGWPHLETIIPQLKKKGIERVTLMPIMMVAGDHASNDMAGDEEDSHKMILIKEGFKVDTYLHGLGENEAVREMFVDRATESFMELQGTLPKM